MSRKMKPRADKSDYGELGPAPDFMNDDIDPDFFVRKSGDKYNYLISRARYAGHYGADRHRERLQLLIAADDIEACTDRSVWLDIMYSIYPQDRLYGDETLDRPSDVRAEAVPQNQVETSHVADRRAVLIFAERFLCTLFVLSHSC